MKTLIVYYSRTGLTKKVAISISKKIDAELDGIIDKKDRSGAIGYMTAGKDAMKNNPTDIIYEKDPKYYDVIIIGGPVWAWTVTPAIRTYLDKNAKILKDKRIAFFATQGSSGAEGKFKEMERLLGTKPLSTFVVNGKDFRHNDYEKGIDDFIAPLKIY